MDGWMDLGDISHCMGCEAVICGIHILLVNINYKLKKLQRTSVKTIKYDVGNLGNDGITEAFRNRILNKWDNEVKPETNIRGIRDMQPDDTNQSVIRDACDMCVT